MDEIFAAPAHKLHLPADPAFLDVTRAATAGQGLRLDDNGKLPSGIGSGPLLTGRVAAAGTITAGTGFTVNKSAAGTYVITFSPTLAATPLILVCNDDSTQASFVRVSGESTSGCTVETYNASVVHTDTAFTFVAFQII